MILTVYLSSWYNFCLNPLNRYSLAHLLS